MRTISCRSIVLVLALVVGASAGCSAQRAKRPGEHHRHVAGGDSHAAHVEHQPAVPMLAQADKPGAPLFGDLGDHHFAITTASEKAQRYFDQGLVLAYGFNHAEAIRSFREAARLDPDCAMCFWGIALAYGPNINAPMDDAAVPLAWDALREAVVRADRASARERAYIAALQRRYAQQPGPDRSALDAAYAEAMRQVARAYPDDLDATTLAAEALMDTMPWDYYEADGEPKPATLEVVSGLERVLAASPDHPGAIHLYIHIIEPSSNPARAEAAADRLRHLVPGAGHLVHMPSHIYYRVGRYEDAARANELAAAADESYIAQCRAQGYYPAGYYPHNLHFLWAASSLEGRSEVALAAARRLATAAPDEQFEAYPMMEDFRPTYHFTLVRFGRWQQILEESAPPSSLHYSTAMWHYARGMALAHLDRRREAAEELSDLFVIARSKDMQELVMWSGAPAKTLLGIAVDVLAAELAWQASDYDEAIARLRAGVEKQDSFAYTEPPPWYFPVRQALGAALLESGRPAEAEAVYREDLAKHPRNGWSLYGLAASLRAQGKADAAATVTARFDQAWRRADVALDRSYF